MVPLVVFLKFVMLDTQRAQLNANVISGKKSSIGKTGAVSARLLSQAHVALCDEHACNTNVLR